MSSRIGLVLALLGLLAFPQLSRAQYSPIVVGSTTTNTAPYYYAGRVSVKKGTVNYIGSGAVIKPRSVVTCAHVLWSASTGWATNVYFDRALAGSSYLSRSYASSKIILGGYTSAVRTYGVSSQYSFARDLGGLVFSSQPANGGYCGWWANPALLTGGSYNMSLGYGAVTHSGTDLLRSAPSRTSSQYYGGYYRNTSYTIEAGMSGGPVFAQSSGNWYLCAVNVSGSSTSTGVRAFDSTAQTFINNNLY